MQTATLLNRWLGFAFSKPEPGSANWYFRRDRLALLCLYIILFMIFIAIAAPILTPIAVNLRTFILFAKSNLNSMSKR